MEPGVDPVDYRSGMAGSGINVNEITNPSGGDTCFCGRHSLPRHWTSWTDLIRAIRHPWSIGKFQVSLARIAVTALRKRFAPQSWGSGGKGVSAKAETPSSVVFNHTRLQVGGAPELHACLIGRLMEAFTACLWDTSNCTFRGP